MPRKVVVQHINDCSMDVSAAAPQSLLGANYQRKLLVLVNDGSNNIYVRLGADAPPSLNSGLRLNAGGGSLVLDRQESMWFGSVSALAETATTKICGFEVYWDE